MAIQEQEIKFKSKESPTIKKEATATKKTTPKKRVGLSAKFMSSDSKWSQLSMLIYGPPGSGKTYFAGTSVDVPSMREVLFIDNDGGTRTLMDNPRFPGIKIVRMYNYADYNPLTNWLIKGVGPSVDVFKEELGDPLQYKTIVIDNLKKLHEMILAHILETESFARFHKEIPVQTDYRLAIFWMDNILKTLSQHSMVNDVNIILTAHVQGITDENNVLLQRVPMIPGILSTSIPGDMPIVAYMSAEGSKKTIGLSKTAPTIQYTAYFDPFDRYTIVKSQTTKKLGSMVDPSMEKLYNLIKS